LDLRREEKRHDPHVGMCLLSKQVFSINACVLRLQLAYRLASVSAIPWRPHDRQEVKTVAVLHRPVMRPSFSYSRRSQIFRFTDTRWTDPHFPI
jgi:hypothetical protein